MFLQVSVILSTEGGGRAWLLRGGMRGCSGGACMVAWGGGVCMVAPGGMGGMRGCSGGHAWLLWGGVHAGGLRGCSGGVCMVAPGGCVVALGGGMHGFSDEIWSMSGRYASYWNAFLFILKSILWSHKRTLINSRTVKYWYRNAMSA